VADIEKISSLEYAIDGNLSRFTGMAGDFDQKRKQAVG